MFKILILSLFVLSVFSAVSGCGGGGGGTGNDEISSDPEPFFLYVSEPIEDDAIYHTTEVTIRGQTLPNAIVSINGTDVIVDSSGVFNKVLSITSQNPNVFNISASKDGVSYIITKRLYYQNLEFCTIVYSAKQQTTGRDRIFDYDPAIPNSQRPISPDTLISNDSMPALSPDRKTVLFVRDLDGVQRLMKVPCSNINHSTTLDSGGSIIDPAWSKDGSMIAYSSSKSGNFEIYTRTIDGANPKRITDNNSYDFSPTFSNSGSSIIYSSNMHTFSDPEVADKYSLWKIELDQTLSTPALVFNAEMAEGPTCPQGSGGCSSLYPDLNNANILVFQFEYSCSLNEGGVSSPGQTCNDLYSMSLNDLNSLRKLIFGNNNYHRPRWNVGGAKISFLNTSENTNSAAYVAYTNQTAFAATSINIVSPNSIDW